VENVLTSTCVGKYIHSSHVFVMTPPIHSQSYSGVILVAERQVTACGEREICI